jgi:hypothetical protein
MISRKDNSQSKRQLRDEKLLETVGKFREQIAGRFPNSGILGLAEEIEKVTREALDRAAAIRRPNWWLRAGLALLILIAVAAVVVHAPSREGQVGFWKSVVEFLEATKFGAAALTAAAVFLVTLETRIKRRRALKAVHELRAMAHIIDMHQLTKTPGRLNDPKQSLQVSGKEMNAEDMVRYLNYCTELLALISKIGQVYVQDFADPVAQTAVDHFESLATGLSSGIWQKLMILDRIQSTVAAK